MTTAARIAVAPHKYFQGSDGTDRVVPWAYEILDLRAALERVYDSDAHCVTYTVPGARFQPRINKAGLPDIPSFVGVGVFFCDVDLPNHGDWTPELLAEAEKQYATLDILAHAGVYHTAHGRRIVQPIAEPIYAEDVEPYLLRWLMALEAAGISGVDFACRDWTRHFRMPHVRRDGRQYRSPFVHLDRMRPIQLEPLPQPTPGADPNPSPPRGSKKSNGTPRTTPIDWTADVPAAWQPRIRQMAEALRDLRGRHRLYMALAGAFLARAVPPPLVPAICRAISIATKTDPRTADREMAARTTVQRHQAGLPIVGYGALRRESPGVADAFDAAMARGSDARARAQASAPPPEPPRSAEETRAALLDTIRSAPEGLTLISAECGIGKTDAAITVSVERAQKSHTSKNATGARAPLQSKTSISVDKNELAIQVTEEGGTGGSRCGGWRW